ncbi:hypothetical protein [Lactiplantibacillus plantarum]|uniref:hypothetical protein n=1 Tax=Lactiplantibacillus plantarum TaxID=1590 RepID=UPI001BA6C68B|nr:hypothetical protein [Lactiplantibacillus plantarum]MBS0936606.1 hypothetical protein [Lactiplantibacillus plantarum]MBS0943813.1 hypothetical protein [Lactiplantibacillus plantarum]
MNTWELINDLSRIGFIEVARYGGHVKLTDGNRMIIMPVVDQQLPVALVNRIYAIVRR